MNENKEKEKKKELKQKLLLTASLIIVFVTIVYLLTSTDLITVKGYNNMESAKWDIHFENLKEKTIGDARVIKSPKILKNATYIGDYEVSLTKPGDEVIYTFDVVNSGTFNSSLKDIIMSKIKCKSSINLKKDEEIVCGNIIYEIEYLNGNKLKINDELNVGDRRPLKLTLKYDGNTLPENKVQVYNITTILLYNQK